MVSWILSLALYASVDAPDLERTLESILKTSNPERFHNRLLKCYTSKSVGDVFDTSFLFLSFASISGAFASFSVCSLLEHPL